MNRVGAAALSGMASTLPVPARDRQHAEIAIRFGRRSRLRVAADFSSGGILSIAALVSSILLSTAVVVTSAGRARRDRP